MTQDVANAAHGHPTETRQSADAQHVDLTVSHVGYQPRRIRIDVLDPPAQLPVRLVPQDRFGPELVVTTALLETDVDTTWHHLLRPGVFSSLGESGVLRSLQTLPSVSLSSAVSPGLNVRGSRADGFQVLLDGMSIYNQNHFFGLFDAFNEDALQTVGLYYGVTPPSLQGPPGGTLSFVTRTGSQTGVRRSVGVTNTAWNATLEGPLLDGRGSWLVSGRRSYLNALDWFNNHRLIALGLDVGRETSLPAGPAIELPERALQPGGASAHFYDVHGKLYYEGTGRQRIMLTLYVGGDHAQYDAERLVGNQANGEPRARPVLTRNDWGNEAASLLVQVPHGSRAFSQSLAGFSRYRSEFSKDDFVYTDPSQAFTPLTDTVRHVLRPFRNENELLELKLAQHADVALPPGGTWSAGYALHRYEATYQEHSAFRATFGQSLQSTQVDLFTQYVLDSFEHASLTAGIRSHYFSEGRFLRLSPRIRLRVFPEARLSVGAGYSRNYQFLHRLYLQQSTNADVWVMSTATQPPGTVDLVSGGLYLDVSRTLFVQMEAYRKSFANLREHETSAARRRLQLASPLLDPWLHDNEGLALGLEAMIRKILGPTTWTTSYTLSKMDIRNERIDGGRPFPADWDRRHQFTAQVDVSVARGLAAHAVWVLASGTPNALAQLDPTEPARLGPYHRMDAGILFRLAAGDLGIQTGVSIFNVYDRRNAWYRNPISVVVPSPRGRQVAFTNVDVYDLGFQPSFEVKVTF